MARTKINEEEKSIFLEYFGTSPMIRILDFLISARIFDYSMTEIARNANVGWSAFTSVWKHLLNKRIVVQTRTIGNAKMFKLNLENPAVQKLVKLDQELTKMETNKFLTKKVKISA